jgi:hypothetical protein
MARTSRRDWKQRNSTASARANKPREAATRIVNHSSELIRNVYQCEKFEDVAQYREAVTFSA